MGIISVSLAYHGHMREAYFALIGAVIFDTFDGMLARKLGLNRSGPDVKKRVITLGGILDDIADGISFCIVPALIFYFLLDNSHIDVIHKMPYEWVALLYAVMGIVRLIYFTRDSNPIPGFFKGMPTPAAALFISAPLIMFQQSIQMNTGQAVFWGKFCFVSIIFTSVLMNLYSIHYIHVARSAGRYPRISKTLLLLILVFVFTPYFGHFSLFLLLLYTLSPLVTWRIRPEVHQKKQHEHEREGNG